MIYAATALVAVTLLVTALATDRANHERIARDSMLLTVQLRAEHFSRHLALLAGELKRLGLQSELNLLDENLEPERSLLRLSHSKSTFFNVGVAILDTNGIVLWSEPQSFMTPQTNLSSEPWFESVRKKRALGIVPVAPEREFDSLVYVVSPLIRTGQFAGALLGAVDLASGETVEPQAALKKSLLGRTVIATRDGQVVYPPKPPRFSQDPGWIALFHGTGRDAFGADATLSATPTIVAGAPVEGTDLVLLSLIPTDVLFASARDRFNSRLLLGLALALIPNLLLILQLRRALRDFQRSEDAALRDERLRFLGEAANLIAHEVKNALNGIRLGLDMILSADRAEKVAPKNHAAAGLRREVERLSEFTTELLTFSKGVVPRPVSLELSEFVERVADLAVDRAKDLGVSLEVSKGLDAVRVSADPSLIHVIVTNLVGNALEAAAGAEVSAPKVEVSIERSNGVARVTVADNGPGVSESMRTRLFEPFTTSKPSGVGIGLALSRKIARAHQGELALVESPANSGATFVLTLPAEG